MTTQAASPRVTVTLTRAINKIDAGLDFLYRILGYICGTMLLLLGLYITYQVIVRKFGVGPVLGNQELIGGYILAFAGTWAFSYSLRTGSHVRIDVLLPLFSRIHPYMRSTADWLALGLGRSPTRCARARTSALTCCCRCPPASILICAPRRTGWRWRRWGSLG